MKESVEKAMEAIREAIYSSNEEEKIEVEFIEDEIREAISSCDK